jgi:hypothetical protein
VRNLILYRLLATLARSFLKLIEQQNLWVIEINVKIKKIPEMCEAGFRVRRNLYQEIPFKERKKMTLVLFR